jgi:hypothetical protein
MIPFSQLERWFRVLLVLWGVVSERETTVDPGPGLVLLWLELLVFSDC